MNYEDGMPAGGNSRIRAYPARMSERQQLALLMQMTSQEMVSGGNRQENTSATSTPSRSSSLQQQRGAKGRWSNKNGESPVQTAINRKEDFRVRQMLVNGYDINASRETNGAAGSPEESATAAPGSPCSPAETGAAAATAAAAPSGEQQEQQAQQQQLYQQQPAQYQQQQRATGSAAAAASQVPEDSGASCEMRRTPPQNKVDRSGTGQSGSSPRVTLRLNQVRGARDEKKGGSASNSRQGGMSAQGQGSMETSSKAPASSASSASGGNAASGSGTSGNASSSTDSGDIYEFKSSKEPTPVRGASSSPNPNPDKEKDGGSKPSSNQGSQSSGSNTATVSGSTTSASEATTAPLAPDESSAVSTSPSSKRTFEGDNVDEQQDEENRRKKRKDSEAVKENAKNNTTGRQSAGRNTSGGGEKCVKSGKQGSGAASGKGSQNTSSISADRKSPSASSMASSPKPSNAPSSTSTKTGTPAPPESDGEEDRSKSSDSNSAPKVPPLKIVIPQSTASEQEQGNRNGKNIASRSHQLPYVVASSNSNDSTEKDQNQSASGTTSPTEGNTTAKGEDKKDFGGSLHGEERSTHHQRVLRSSHRTGNGNNGSTASKETVPSSGNGSYSNSSPLPANASMDRSNNSSPQQRHHSPTPETTGSDVSSKTASSESASAGTVSKSNTTVEKSEKNADAAGKNQKDSGVENLENVSATTSSAMSNAGTPAPPVELHPRKRKMKPNKEAQQAAATAAEAAEATSTGPEVHPHDQPITNCYQLFLNIRKQIERRRKGLFPVQPKPPQGFKDYLMNRCTYVLAGNAKEPNINPPVGLHGAMKDLYVDQEKERYRLRMQHVVEKEKLVLSVEQEILRVHGRAARALANQSLPFSVCTILKDEEVYNVITPEQEEKDRNARSRYNGRLFLSWLQDVDDKWEKIKEGMLLRHHNEAESLHAVQRMHWEWKLKEVGLCEYKATPQVEDVHVPMVHVSDDFDLLPA
ncbi:ankyrin repeat domain-containing protein 12 isoform X2 [Linepithema humile]|uniref:ankyrin repeat domain-containing protein 12 isoform X2 n=1 Tax=Linepithema humile TaxID=83485 RepID=UPI0006236A59|nr:PREDICTED: ankyrin repeat domain-containing protein 12 isoform X2 [Linepithema humile]